MNNEIKLSKSDMLFIRACKSKQPMQRLMSLRKRLYGTPDSHAFVVSHLGSVLIELCEKLDLLTLKKLVFEMRDKFTTTQVLNKVYGRDSVEPSMDDCVLGASMYAIRFAEGDKLANLVPMRRFIRDEIKAENEAKLRKIYTESNSV